MAVELLLEVRDDADLGRVVDADWAGMDQGWLGFVNPETAGFFRIGPEAPSGTRVLDHAIPGHWRAFLLDGAGSELASRLLEVPPADGTA